MKGNNFWFLGVTSALIVAIMHGFALTYSLYWSLSWFDLLAHFIGGFAIANIVFALHKRLEAQERISFGQGFLYAFLVTGILSLVWEIFELVIKMTFVSDQYALDTALDVILAAVGVLLAGVYARRVYKREVVSDPI